MQRLDTKFLFLAALLLCVGVGMGIFMAGSQDFSLMPVHAHVNLVGWASLALFGLTYRAYPELQERRAARAHFALAVPAALLFPVGIYMAITYANELLVVIASLAWAAGTLLFLGQMAGLAFGGTRTAAAPLPAE